MEICLVTLEKNSKGGDPVVWVRGKIHFLKNGCKISFQAGQEVVVELTDLPEKKFGFYRPLLPAEMSIKLLEENHIPFFLRLNPTLGKPAFVIGHGYGDEPDAISIPYQGECDNEPFLWPSGHGDYSETGFTIGELLPFIREIAIKRLAAYFFIHEGKLKSLVGSGRTGTIWGNSEGIKTFSEYKWIEEKGALFTPDAQVAWGTLKTQHAQAAERWEKENAERERVAKSRRVALTGTFKVKREDLEQKLREAGHEVGDLSSSTQILLVGEKTASLAKIQKAREKFRIWVLEATDPNVILEQLATRTASGYISSYDRGFEPGEDEETEALEVGLVQVADVFGDYVDRQGDAGEWTDDDAKSQIEEMLTHSADEFFSDLREWVAVDVVASEKADFIIEFFRLCFLDAITEPGVWEDITVANLMSPKFYDNFKFLSLVVLCEDFEIEDLKEEIKDDEDKMALIRKAKEGESKLKLF